MRGEKAHGISRSGMYGTRSKIEIRLLIASLSRGWSASDRGRKPKPIPPAVGGFHGHSADLTAHRRLIKPMGEMDYRSPLAARCPKDGGVRLPPRPASKCSRRPTCPGRCSWRKITSRWGPWTTRHPPMRRSYVRRTPGPTPGCRRQISLKIATALKPLQERALNLGGHATNSSGDRRGVRDLPIKGHRVVLRGTTLDR